MLSIIGTKIIMQQGDDCAFKVKLVNDSGNPVSIGDNDRIVMRVRRKDSHNVILKKIDNKEYKDTSTTDPIYLFILDSEDTAHLDFGDYLYDLTVESSGRMYTLTTNSQLSLLRSNKYSDPSKVEIMAPTFPEHALKVYPEPLICRFNYSNVYRVTETSGTLVLF